jgi:DNA-binding transcriptional regulator GbsR (MarR family)
MMARAWGINPTMGELFALLFISGDDWTAEDLRARLDVSRGNVSMNLRELLGWGVVRRVHRTGERRELYRAEADVWTLFQRIVTERKRRELEPTVKLLDDLAAAPGEEGAGGFQDRVQALRRFLGMLDALSSKLMAVGPDEAAELGRLLLGEDDGG